jgi:hypothetical protein
VALLLTGGGGMPALDGALYHYRVTRDHPAGPHFEPSGTAHTHGEMCRVGSTLPHSTRSAPVAGWKPAAEWSSRPQARPLSRPRPSDLAILPPSRAPPGLPV